MDLWAKLSATLARASARDLLAFGEHNPVGDWDDPSEKLRDRARELGVRLLDLRGFSRVAHYGPREHCHQRGHDFGQWGWFAGNKPGSNRPKRGRARGVRDWAKCSAIMLHTTGVPMTAPRFLGVPAHAGIAKDGTIVLMHPTNAYLWHGHTANSFSIGVEISGRSSIEAHQIEPARALVQYLHEDRQQHHEAPMAIMAHRQSHRSRPNDPGKQVWGEVGEWGMSELGLKLGPTVGSGKDIPQEWRS